MSEDNVQGAVKIGTSDIKKLGHLAERNTETMSADQKAELAAKHKTKRIPQRDLPNGMTRLPAAEKGEW